MAMSLVTTADDMLIRPRCAGRAWRDHSPKLTPVTGACVQWESVFDCPECKLVTGLAKKSKTVLRFIASQTGLSESMEGWPCDRRCDAGTISHILLVGWFSVQPFVSGWLVLCSSPHFASVPLGNFRLVKQGWPFRKREGLPRRWMLQPQTETLSGWDAIVSNERGCRFGRIPRGIAGGT